MEKDHAEEYEYLYTYYSLFSWKQCSKCKKDFRREKMFKELEARYKQADWNCKVKIDTEMSMNSCDYWILTPKKQ